MKPQSTPKLRSSGLLVLAGLLSAATAQSRVYDWNGPADGDANAVGNWTHSAGTPTFEDGSGFTDVVLRSTNNGNRVAILSGNLNVEGVRINSTGDFTFGATAGGNLILHGNTSTTLLGWIPSSSAGSLTIDAPMTIQGQGRFRAEGNTMNLNGPMTINTTGTVGFFPENGEVINVTGNINAAPGNPTIEFIGNGVTVLSGNNELGTGGLRIRGTFGHTLVLASNNALGGATNQNFAIGDGNATTGSVLTEGAVSINRNFRIRRDTSAVFIGGRSAHESSFNGTILIGESGHAAPSFSLTAAAGGRVNFSGQLELASGATNPTLGTVTIAADPNGTVAFTHLAGNTYQGNTVVQSGTLLVNNSSGSATGTGNVLVQNGAAFGVNGGGAIIAGDLHFNSGASFVFSTATLTVGGDVTFDGFGVSNILGLDSSVGIGTYTLIAGNVSAANLSNIGSSNAFDLGDGRSAYFEINSLDLVVIPEPGTIAFLGGLLALGFVAWRRRHS
jgi:autotransporter-associated beta strand protein